MVYALPVLLLLFSHQVMSDSTIPRTYSLPGFSVHGIFHTRILEWVAIPPLGDLPHPGIEPESPAWSMDSLSLSHLQSPMHFLYWSFYEGRDFLIILLKIYLLKDN